MATVIGIDYGNKKIGFATGQAITKSAAPLKVVFQNGDMWKNIDEIFTQWQPQLVIIGKPVLADGKKHPLEKTIETFIIDLKLRYGAIVVHRENEAYSSFEAGLRKQKRNRGAPLDAEAAAIILESWMRSKA